MDTKMFIDVLLHIHTDSTGAKATATRTGLAPKTKHMQLRYLWIENCFTTSMAKLHKTGTKENMPDVMTKYATAEILRYLGVTIGLVTTTVVMALCADFDDYYEAEVTDVTNNNSSKPTTEHCKQSTEHCPKAPNAPRPYTGAQPLPYDETVENHCFLRVQAVHCSSHCQATAMATAYGFELLGDMSSTGDRPTAKVEKTAVRTATPGVSSTGQGTDGRTDLLH
jgi:hypothetical protein